MPGLLLILALQAATAPAPPPSAPDAKPERFSILVPVGNEPCIKRKPDDVVICGDAMPSQKLPYPDEVVPNGPVASNPYLRGTGALDAEATPCAVASQGCLVGFGPPIVPMIKGAVDLAKKAFAKKPDKTGRVEIPLDGSDAPAGRVEP